MRKSGFGKIYSFSTKIISIIIVTFAYLVTSIKSGQLPNFEQVQGLLLVASFIGGSGLTVDISKIIQNIRGKNE